jgi:ABC-2 type transport system permease protein
MNDGRTVPSVEKNAPQKPAVFVPTKVAAFIAIGVFLSSLTENQLIAAVAAMGVNAAMLLISLLAGNVESTFWRTVLKWFSVIDRFTPFVNQMLDVSAIVYYISLAAIAIFITTRVIEKRRWA